MNRPQVRHWRPEGAGSLQARARRLLARRPTQASIVVIVLLAVLVHLPQWLLPTHSDPLWLFGGIAGGGRRGWLPGSNYLDPYMAFTTDSIGRLVARDWLHGIVPWWNPYVGIGVPLAGQMQPSVFLLPFVLLLALPGGIVWLTIAMQIVAGLGTLGLLRELRCSRLAALIGAALYELNGTIAWVPGPAAVFCTLAFLPVLLWGIERARHPEHGAAAILGIAVGIGGSLVAGFPETAYIDGLMGLGWAILRCVGGPNGGLLAGRVVAGGLIGVAFASPVLIAFADEMAGSQLASQHLFGLVSIDPRAFSLMFMPLIFGPINSGSMMASIGSTWGNIGGYSSALIVMLALLANRSRAADRPLHLALGVWILLLLAKTFGFPPVMMLFNLLPAMKQVAFYRYAPPAWELAFIVLAAKGIDGLHAATTRQIRVALLGAVAVAVACSVIAADADATHWSALRAATTARFLIVSVMFVACLLGTSYVAAVWRPAAARRVIAVLLVGEAAATFCVPQATGPIGGKRDLAAVRFLQTHAGLSRVMTLGPIAPNYGAAFGFGMLNHNMTPVPQRWLDYIDHVLLPGFLSKDRSGATFWPVRDVPPGDPQTLIRMLKERRQEYRQMGVRYLVASKQLGPLPAVTGPKPVAGGTPLVLAPGGMAEIVVPAPALSDPVAAAGILIGTYGGLADGSLAIRVCDGGVCRSGAAPLGGLADNGIDYVTLDAPLRVAAGERLVLDITHVGGRSNLAIWTWPTTGPVQARGPDLAEARVTRAPQLAVPVIPQIGLRVAQGPDWRLAFAGPSSDVWEMPDPLPYFDADGCGLDVSARTSVRTECKRPSVLIRRELFSAGWHADLDGVPVPIELHHAVLQGVMLPAGRHTVTFWFVPPYMTAGWSLAAAAALASIWQAVVAIGQRRTGRRALIATPA